MMSGNPRGSMGWPGFFLLLLPAIILLSGPAQFAEARTRSNPVANNMRDLFVELAKKTVPSVVNIYTTQKVDGQDDLQRRMLEEFFGLPRQPGGPRARSSLGTGFIIDEDEGLILTNYHVVAQADEIKVLLAGDKRETDSIPAEVVGGDAEGDVALIRIKTDRDLQEVKLGSSDDLEVGEWVMAVGNPFGLGSTVTKGIVSAKGRVFPMSQFANYIQTDAPINPGNSGGPLINTAGEVIGINTFINAAAQGIGFAIQIDYVKNILEDLKTKGTVTRGYIGIQIEDLTPELAENLNIDKDVQGVVVTNVQDGHAAEKAGMKPYDVITAVNGRKTASSRKVIAAITAIKPGEKAELRILRNKKWRTLSVKVGERPSRADLYGDLARDKKGRKFSVDVGMELTTVTPDIARARGLAPKTRGVLVRTVRADGPADKAGIVPGNIILEVNRKRVNSVKAFYRAVQKGRKFVLRILDEGGYQLRTLDLSGS